MLRVCLSKIQALPEFEEGFALATYQRICRLINRFGVHEKISIPTWSTEEEKHAALTQALDRLEYQ